MMDGNYLTLTKIMFNFFLTNFFELAFVPVLCEYTVAQ